MTIEDILGRVEKALAKWDKEYASEGIELEPVDWLRVLAAEVRRLREERDVYEPAAKNWPAMLKRCETAEANARGERDRADAIQADLAAARAEAKQAWDEAVQARVDGAQNIVDATAALEADLAAARAEVKRWEDEEAHEAMSCYLDNEQLKADLAAARDAHNRVVTALAECQNALLQLVQFGTGGISLDLSHPNCAMLLRDLARVRGEVASALDSLDKEVREHGDTQADLAALRQRHAEAVEQAFREGYGEGVRWGAYLPGVTKLPPSDEDAAWLASEAKASLA